MRIQEYMIELEGCSIFLLRFVLSKRSVILDKLNENINRLRSEFEEIMVMLRRMNDDLVIQTKNYSDLVETYK